MKYLMFIVQNTKDLDNIAVDVDISISVSKFSIPRIEFLRFSLYAGELGWTAGVI